MENWTTYDPKKGDEEEMKHGKRLTKKHKILLKEKHLNHENWLLERDTPNITVFIHRYDETRKIEIRKGER